MKTIPAILIFLFLLSTVTNCVKKDDSEKEASLDAQSVDQALEIAVQSDKAIINWENFDLEENEIYRIKANKGAEVLMRVKNPPTGLKKENFVSEATIRFVDLDGDELLVVEPSTELETNE